jgi:hypothetical protein
MKFELSELSAHFQKKTDLLKMIDRFGMEETVNRFSWLYDVNHELAKKVIEEYLGDYIDDNGVINGNFFWGDL